MGVGGDEVWVVDASVVIKWHLMDEEYGDEAAALAMRFGQGDLALVAPEQIRFEVASAITVAASGREPRISVEQGKQAIAEFLDLDIQTVGDNELVLGAYYIAHRQHCAFYDALYLALAERLAVPFVTADGKLYRLTRSLPYVLWIGDC